MVFDLCSHITNFIVSRENGWSLFGEAAAPPPPPPPPPPPRSYAPGGRFPLQEGDLTGL